MAVLMDSAGRLTVRNTIETTGLAGRIFKRREPANDAADMVIALGATNVGTAGVPCAELVVASATFGAIPEGWDAATVTFDLESFAAEYSEINDAERAVFAAEAAADSRAADEANGRDKKRASPWSRS